MAAGDIAGKEVGLPSAIPIDETEKQELLASIRQSQKDFEQGKGIPIEEVRKEIPKWANG